MITDIGAQPTRAQKRRTDFIMGELLSVMPWIWLGVTIAAIVSEAATLALVAVWFIPSALVSLVISLFRLPVWLQAAVFLAMSLALMIFLKPFMKKVLKVRYSPTNADTVIGKTGTVIEKIDNIAATGAVKADGKVWTARSDDDSVTIDEGSLVRAVAIEGVKLICKKEN